LPLEQKELDNPPKEESPKNDDQSNLYMTQSNIGVLNTSFPKYSHLLTSPVRKLLYPKIYPGYHTNFHTELQKEAAIVNELERLTR